MSIRSDHFDGAVATDFYDTFCGQRLGGGVGREVFINRFDPTTVIKIETGFRSFQNILEWELWECQQYHKPVSKWLAPCVSISPCGIVLIQKRTEPIPTKLLPKEIPSWCWDVKQENWSLYEGRPVMHDYGITGLLANAPKRMKKADFSTDF